MRTIQPQVPPQLSAVDQYPQSGMRMPQVDAIRRARLGGGKPLYAAAEEVMGGQPSLSGQSIGNVKPMAEGGSFSTKPMQENSGMTKPAVEMGKKPLADPNSKFGADPRMRMFGRTRPVSAAKPAPVMSPQIRELS